MAKLNPATFHKSIHVKESELGQQTLECPFCFSTDRENVGILQDTPLVLLLKCNFCFAVSASRIPTQEAINEYYNKLYEPEKSDRITFNDISRFGRHLACNFSRYNSKKNNNISILDFGGGNGAISFSVAEQLIIRGVDSITIFVVDYGESVIQTVKNKISIHKVSNLENLDGNFDFVIASAVIEHLQEPSKTIDSLMSCLKEGGIFYARTPYVAPLLKALSIIKVGIDFTYPAHLHDLGQDFWEKYFNQPKYIHNFSLVQSKPSIVQTTFRDNFLQSAAAYILKAPWFLFGKYYKFVGGWEVFVRKNSCA